MNLKELKKPLEIEQIDFRIQSINKGKYATILAYKDARVDMNTLDDVVGAENWHRDHKEVKGVIYCGVGIQIGDRLVWKYDAGSESMTAKEKGEASDSFKRACFNWGIGRELYDYPVIQIKLNENEVLPQANGSFKQSYNLNLKKWLWISEFTDGQVTGLACRDTMGKVRYNFGKFTKKKVI